VNKYEKLTVQDKLNRYIGILFIHFLRRKTEGVCISRYNDRVEYRKRNIYFTNLQYNFITTVITENSN